MPEPFNHPSSLTNTPEISVGDLSLAIKKTIEGAFGFVRVRGELSKVTLAKSGHLYTALKDDVAVLDAVCWKGTVLRLGIKPEEGMEVVCTGRLTTYPGRSNYQLVIESMELAGVGAILKMLEERKKKLAAEGLFDAARKKPLPFLPRIIGVVTSPTGAVIRDILHRIADRFPCHVIVWPAVVQGASAAAEVARGIAGLNALPNPPDVIIVARGGGSFEDLMPFNEEVVVRAAAASKVPLISAVGHETDVTLIDFAADIRAPTPTGAAEMAVPVRDNVLAQVLDDEQRLLQTMSQRLETLRDRLKTAARPLASPARLLEAPTQRLDRAAMQTEHAFEKNLTRSESKLVRLALRTPADVVNAASLKLKNANERLATAQTKMLDKPVRDVDGLARILESLSFKKVLERGYAVLRNDQGQLVGRKNNLTENQQVTITLYDGDAKASITKA
ncbi:MAG: exodeoxyribonuclease VII large subunit [Proteobacteria bacterium]|nr:exodeoxyribonuclease VII large subunit [Pseudomonadota bacterium]